MIKINNGVIIDKNIRIAVYRAAKVKKVDVKQIIEYYDKYNKAPGTIKSAIKLAHTIVENYKKSSMMACSHCGTKISKEENAGTKAFPLCHQCFTDHYNTCSNCNSIIHKNKSWQVTSHNTFYCYTCHCDYDHNHNSIIRNYGYKPNALFHGKESRFFGVELEIDGASGCSSDAWAIEDIANGDGTNRLYIKHDGSLNNGMELVTHPMSLEYHVSEMPWQDILRKAVQLDYTSHNIGTCGLHVHVNRDGLGATLEEQRKAIARVLYFTEKHWNEISRFTRRTSAQLQHWANRYGYHDDPQDYMTLATNGNNERYKSINLKNTHTIEFRIFRGTLKYNTFIATLQMVNRICDIAVNMDDNDIKGLSWSEFVSQITEPELIQYLKERRIYINEEVNTEEEI